MKLTKIKLINWHIFTDITIDVADNTLITGENACGKSTLIDAIYFVLSGGDDKCFNNAANIDARRTIETYIRGKLGNEGEGKEALRNSSDVICHIALEFKEDERYMILGTIIEITDGSNPKEKFYVIQNRQIIDEDYIENNKIFNYFEFKNRMKVEKVEFSENGLARKAERRRTICRDILKLDEADKYITLLRKAIAFKPINEVSTFVNDFLLREDSIRVDSLIEEFRSYREIKAQLDREQKKIEVLEGFINKAEKYYENDKTMQYLSAVQLEIDINKQRDSLARYEKDLNKIGDSIAEIDKYLEKNHTDIDFEKDQERSLLHDDKYRALKEKRDKLDQIKKECELLAQEVERIERLLSDEKRIIATFGFKYRFSEDIKNDNYSLLKEHLREYSGDLDKKRTELFKELIKCENLISENNANILSLNDKLENIRKGKNTYDGKVTKLLALVRDGLFNKYGREIEAHPLCEYLEINDSRWSKAIEGYLNTQRFNLILDPKYYDDAVAIYEKYKQQESIYGVGIMNCKSEIKNIEVDPNSLFAKLEIENKYARFAAHMLLGKVIGVDTIEELKNHDISITDSGMLYKNRTARNINPEVYKIPYIGKDSISKREQILEEQLEELKNIKNESVNLKRRLESDKELLDSSHIYELLKIDNNLWHSLRDHENQKEQLLLQIEFDEKDSGLLEIQDKLDGVRNRLEGLVAKKEEYKAKRDQLKENSGEKLIEIKNVKLSLENKQKAFVDRMHNIDSVNYEKQKAKYIDYNKIDENLAWKDYESAQNYNNACKRDIESGMREYVVNYVQSMSATIENIVDFVREYHKLKDRDIVAFRDRADAAYERCIDGFRNDFISKLAFKIDEARKTLTLVNKNLKNNPFGSAGEIYQFTCEASADDEMREYYRIIMSGKVMEKNTLLDEVLDDKEQEIMRTLLNNIIAERNGTESEKKLQRYLDYRSYMRFDVKTTNKYGAESYFSKTHREKSGGETQTPFYVIIAACFDQLMKKNTQESSTCTVIFDEAFNNMDESRINSLMEFYKKLNIQLIIVVPANRMSSLASYMDTVIGLIRQKNQVIVQSMKGDI